MGGGGEAGQTGGPEPAEGGGHGAGSARTPAFPRQRGRALSSPQGHAAVKIRTVMSPQPGGHSPFREDADGEQPALRPQKPCTWARLEGSEKAPAAGPTACPACH